MSTITKRILYLLASGLFFVPTTVQAAPGPDLKVENSCTLDPAAGSTVLTCRIEVTNVGSVTSVSPLSLVVKPSAPDGTTLVNAVDSLGCITQSGPVPAEILCSSTQAIAPGKFVSSSLVFSLPLQGGPFKNCVSVAQGQNPGTPADPDLSNNANCSTIAMSGSASPPLGTITIIKEGHPTTSLDIKFTSNVPGFPTFYLDDDSNGTLPNKQVFTIPSGTTYTFTEDVIPGWWLKDINCTTVGGAFPSWNLAARTLSVPLATGQNVTCKFVNQLGQRIRIQKAVVPSGSDEKFNFTGTGPGFSESFVLDANLPDTTYPNTIQFNVPPGSHTFEELASSSSTLVAIGCNPNTNVTYNLAGRSVTINSTGIFTDSRITCVFKNEMKPVDPTACTGYPMNATVNFFAAGWEIVHICRGGTVTFSKTFTSAATVTSLNVPLAFPAVPLASGPATGTTTVFPNAGTFIYSPGIVATNQRGTIIVHD